MARYNSCNQPRLVGIQGIDYDYDDDSLVLYMGLSLYLFSWICITHIISFQTRFAEWINKVQFQWRWS